VCGIFIRNEYPKPSQISLFLSLITAVFKRLSGFAADGKIAFLHPLTLCRQICNYQKKQFLQNVFSSKSTHFLSCVVTVSFDKNSKACIISNEEMSC